MGGSAIAFGYGREAACDHLRVNEVSSDQCVDEVLVLFSESAQFRNTQVFLVEAPSDELRFARWGGGVLVLDFDQSIAPSVGQCRGLQVHGVDTEAVKLLKRGEFARCSFDFVCETGDFTGVVGDR